MAPDSVPEGSIVITPAAMYDRLQQDIGGMSRDVNDLKTSLSPLPVTVADHEQRIRRLERAVWISAGFAAALGSAVGASLSSLMGAR